MLLHKGFIGKIEYDDRRQIMTGEVLNATDLLEFDGKTAQEITDAIMSIPNMSSLSVLTAEEIQAIADYLATL